MCVNSINCSEIFNCCDCGGNDCDCSYCWSCNACEECNGEECERVKEGLDPCIVRYNEYDCEQGECGSTECWSCNACSVCQENLSRRNRNE